MGIRRTAIGAHNTALALLEWYQHTMLVFIIWSLAHTLEVASDITANVIAVPLKEISRYIWTQHCAVYAPSALYVCRTTAVQHRWPWLLQTSMTLLSAQLLQPHWRPSTPGWCV